MAYLTEEEGFPSKIWRIELDTPFEGGLPVYVTDEEGNVSPTGGFDNIQAKQLAERTRNLNIRLLMLENQLLNQRLTALENAGVGDVVEKLSYPANLQSRPDFAFEGVLWLAGQSVSRITYARLFAKVQHLVGGPLWGVGDGSTTFTLPDFRGEFLRGWDGGRGVDSGRSFGSFQDDDFEEHFHRIMDRSTPQFNNDSQGGFDTANAVNQDNGSFVDTEVTGGLETRPRNRAVLLCVRY